MSARRPSFLLRLQPEPRVNGARALRALLKSALRKFGLRAVELREDFAAAAARRSDQWRGSKRAHRRRIQGETVMDMTEFAGSSFLRVDDVRDKPWRGKIANVKTGQFGRPVATFESGEQLTLNVTNTKALIHTYGPDSRDWIGHTIELYAGTTQYQGDERESVLIRPRSAPKPPAPKPPLRDELDDEIPFFK
jgi:hypothetical protein